MKSICTFVVILTLAFSLTSCLKDKGNNYCVPQDPSLESTEINSFIARHGYLYDEDTLGNTFVIQTDSATQVKYQVLDKGIDSLQFENETDGFDASYTGIVMSTDSIFTKDTTVRSSAGYLPTIQALPYSGLSCWATALLYHVGAKGHIRIFSPSASAFSCQGFGNVVQPNQPVYYDIYIKAITR